MWRDLRWITDALQYARYKHPRGGVPITCLVSATRTESDPQDPKTDSTSSTMDYLPTPSPSPELRRRTAANGGCLPLRYLFPDIFSGIWLIVECS